MDTNILLENGTNELEILEFILDGNSYGINVAKIREIIPYQKVTPIPNAHPSIEGIFMPRDVMITAIDLKNCLQRGQSEEKGLFIITNFNKLDIAFHVDQVIGIHRVSWSEIIKPGTTVSNSEDGISTGIVKINDKLIIILDFEKIITDISPETGLKTAEVDALGVRQKNDVPILIAEDSALLNKLIKSDDATKNIPVIIFSSLVNEDMKKKGESLGADAQLSKPEIGNLVRVIDSLVH